MRKRTFIAIIFCLTIIPTGGCGTDSKERLTALQAGVNQLQTRSAQADAAIDALRDIMTETQAMLGDPNNATLAGKIKEVLAKTRAQLEDKLVYKAKVDEQLGVLKAELAKIPAEPDISNEVALVGTTLTNVGTTVGGEVGKWMALVGMIIGAIAGAIPGLLKAKKATTALTEVVKGGEDFKKAVETAPNAETLTAASAVNAFKVAQASAQSASTKELVALARVAA